MGNSNSKAYNDGFEAGKNGSFGGDLGKGMQDFFSYKNDNDKSYDAGYEAGSKERSFDWSFSSDSNSSDKGKSSDSSNDSSDYSSSDYSSSDYSSSDYSDSSDYNYDKSASTNTPYTSSSKSLIRKPNQELSYSNRNSGNDGLKGLLNVLLVIGMFTIILIPVILFIMYLTEDKNNQ